MKQPAQSQRKLRSAWINLGCLVASSTTLHAATITKAGTGTNLNDPAAWVSAAAPTAADVASWNAASLASGLSLSTNTGWLGISTSGTTAEIGISGGGMLTLGASGVNVAGTNATPTTIIPLTLNIPLVLGASQTWSAANGFGINSGASVSGGGSLTFSGDGSNILTGNNSYTGGTTLLGGGVAAGPGATLALGNSNALGSGTLALKSNRTGSNDTVFLAGGINLTNPITIDTTTGREGITSVSGNNTLSGNITITGSTANHIYFKNVGDPGTVFALVGRISGPNMNSSEGIGLRGVAGAFGLISGQITTTGFLQINGAASWTVSSSGNTWNKTIIQGADGGFILGANDALATAARVNWGNDTNGTLDLAGYNQTVGGLDFASNPNAKLPKVGNSSASSNAVLKINGGGYTFLGALVDILGTGNKNLSLELLGGTQTLSGPSTYTGSTTISGGILSAGVASVANVSGAFGKNSAVSISNTPSAAMNITGFDTQIGSIAGGGPAGGNVILGAAMLTAGADNTTTTYSGVISGTGGSLKKVGTGTLILDQANTYTGATTVTNGKLVISGNRTTTATGGILVGNGPSQTGTLEITNGTFTIATSFKVGSGDGTTVGVVNQKSGNLTLSGNLQLLLGNLGAGTTTGTASYGTYNLSGGSLSATPVANRGVLLGVNAGTTGIFNLNGTGSLSIGSSYLEVGRSDSAATGTTGVFNQTGSSTATIGTLTIGGGSGPGYAGTTGTLNLTGGTFSASAFNSLSAGDASISSITIGGTADVTLPAFPTVRGSGSTATLTHDGGTLHPSAPSATYISGLTHAYLTANGARFDVASGNDITIPQLLENAASQSGTLTKSGSGKLTLSGANTYGGATTVDAGTLAVNGTALANTGKLVINGGKVEATGMETVGTLYFGTTQQPVGTYGASGSGAGTIDNVHFSGSGVVSVTIAPGFATWAATYAPGQTADQDHDNDGVRNGVEYFMGTTGSTFTANPQPVNGTITWPRDPAFSGSYVIQTSGTMAAGTWINVPVNGTNPKDNGSSVQYTLPTGQGRLFTRIQVTPN